MVESGSSLFYLLHCSAYDRLNTTTFRSFRNIPHGLHQSSGHNHRCCNNFASAHPAQIASNWIVDVELQYQLCLSISRTDCILLDGNVYWWHDLCLSTSRTDCVSPYLGFRRGREPLPQHIPHGLHRLFDFCFWVVSSFASAHPARIVSRDCKRQATTWTFASAHPAWIASFFGVLVVLVLLLCLSTSRMDCIIG